MPSPLENTVRRPLPELPPTTYRATGLKWIVLGITMYVVGLLLLVAVPGSSLKGVNSGLAGKIAGSLCVTSGIGSLIYGIYLTSKGMFPKSTSSPPRVEESSAPAVSPLDTGGESKPLSASEQLYNYISSHSSLKMVQVVKSFFPKNLVRFTVDDEKTGSVTLTYESVSVADVTEADFEVLTGAKISFKKELKARITKHGIELDHGDIDVKLKFLHPTLRKIEPIDEENVKLVLRLGKKKVGKNLVVRPTFEEFFHTQANWS